MQCSPHKYKKDLYR